MNNANQHIPAGYKPSPLGIIPEDWENAEMKDFFQLSQLIQQVHKATQSETVKAINRNLTLRNWLIGYYIVEYEQKGNDRAKYGDKLLKNLEDYLKTPGLNETTFKLSRSFYLLYPQMKDLLVSKSPTVSDELQSIDNKDEAKGATSHYLQTPAHEIISRLSFSHIREIMTQDKSFARYFYEMECIRCNCLTKTHWKNF